MQSSSKMTERITFRLSERQKEFREKHPLIEYSGVLREKLDEFIASFDEEEYQRKTRYLKELINMENE